MAELTIEDFAKNAGVELTTGTRDITSTERRSLAEQEEQSRAPETRFEQLRQTLGLDTPGGFGSSTLDFIGEAVKPGGVADVASKTVLKGALGTAAVAATGGLALGPIAATVAGAGAFAGADFATDQALQAAGVEKDTALGDDILESLGLFAVDVGTVGVAKVASKVVKPLAGIIGVPLEAIGNKIDDILDTRLALGRAVTNKVDEFNTFINMEEVSNAVGKIRDVILKKTPDARGKVFGKIEKRVSAALRMYGRGIDKTIELGEKQLTAQGKGGTSLTGFFEDVAEGASKLISGKDQKAIAGVFRTESDAIAGRLLDAGDLTAYTRALKQLDNIETIRGGASLFRNNPGNFNLTAGQIAQGREAFTVLEVLKAKLARPGALSLRQFRELKSRFGQLGKWDKVIVGASPEALQEAGIYRGLEEAARGRIGAVIREAGPEFGERFANLNTLFGATKRIQPLVAERAAFERLSGVDLPLGISFFARNLTPGIRGTVGAGGLVSPQSQLAITKGTSALLPLGKLSAPLRIAGKGFSALPKAIESLFNPASVGVVVSNLMQVAQAEESDISPDEMSAVTSAIENGVGKTPEEQERILSGLLKEPRTKKLFGVAPTFSTGLLAGVDTLLDNNKVIDPEERALIITRVNRSDLSSTQRAKIVDEINTEEAVGAIFTTTGQTRPVVAPTSAPKRSTKAMVDRINKQKVSSASEKDFMKAKRITSTQTKETKRLARE